MSASRAFPFALRLRVLLVSGISLSLVVLSSCGAPLGDPSDEPTDPGLIASEPNGNSNGGGAGNIDGAEARRTILPLARLSWSHASPAARGVAINPASGEIYLSVGPGQLGAFERTGGLTVLSPSGQVKATLPLEYAPQRPFEPNSALVTRDGSAVYLGSYAWELFRFEPTSQKAFSLSLSGSRGSEDGTLGIDANGALSADQTKALLPGRQLHQVNMKDGKVEPVLDAGTRIRQIVEVGPDLYLLNLTSDAEGEGLVATWNPKTRSLRKVAYELPIKALASSQGWTVAVVKHANHCAIAQLYVEHGYFEATAIGVFRSGSGPARCSDTRLALNPTRKQVALVAPSPIEAVGEALSETERRDGLWMDFINKTYFRLDVRNGSAAAFSADGSTVFVSDQSGLRAFTLR